MSFPPHFQGESASLCWRVSRRGLCPAGDRRNESPDFTQRHCTAPPPPALPSSPSLAKDHSCRNERVYSFNSDHQHSRSSVFTSVGGFLWGDCWRGSVVHWDVQFCIRGCAQQHCCAVPCRAGIHPKGLEPDPSMTICTGWNLCLHSSTPRI